MTKQEVTTTDINSEGLKISGSPRIGDFQVFINGKQVLLDCCTEIRVTFIPGNSPQLVCYYSGVESK